MKEVNQRIVELIIKQKEENQNIKYGEFIIQTNLIQAFLARYIVCTSKYYDKDFSDKISALGLGELILCLKICANVRLQSIVKDLDQYNKYRVKLAHKMFTNKKLTENDCEKAIETGEKILKILKPETAQKVLFDKPERCLFDKKK